MSKAVITLDKVREGMPSILTHGNKDRTDAQVLTVAANKLNRALYAQGKTQGYKPCADWSGLESWTIQTGGDGKVVTFKIVQHASPIAREVDSFLDSLGEIVPEGNETDAETDTE